ncbi:MFS transporter [Lecanosticta acicola]|uniref:MFS transporter n=1 Tax=Lecanosticta acicola TaxID=111012 RepID=A0AAI8YUM8_9PEZI|nr:MFS transporter [Lecanosticta acicola]
MATKDTTKSVNIATTTSPTAAGIDSSTGSLRESEGSEYDEATTRAVERRLRLKVDLRLCTIAGLLCSLNLLDSGIISSASVTSMISDLGLSGQRYSVAIFIFTIASIAFQLPSTIAARTFGPRVWFPIITLGFGLITMCTAFMHNWKEMIGLRVLLGVAMSGVYPGLTYLISTWYPRHEQQVRFAFVQTGQLIVLATGGIVNFGLNHLNGRAGLEGWRWMYLVQGLITIFLGFVTYFWIVDFPENSHKSLWFLTEEEQKVAVARIEKDRHDVQAEPFTWAAVLQHAKDPKIYGFACMYFLVNIVTTALSYFLPIILSGMGFDENESIILSAPPYYYATIPVILSSIVGDKFNLRGPIIIFNSICLIAGFGMLGFADQVAVRYIGTYLATGAYVSNWAAVTTYQTSNIAGQWKRAFAAAVCTAMNGAGGIAGAYIVKSNEAPTYPTAVWVSIGSHVLLIALVLAFSGYFYTANERQQAGKAVLEGIVGFRYTY